MLIEGLSAIARDFDGMLIDQFGVIHDGQQLYPGSAEVLQQLHAARIPVVVMTNSGKRAAANRERLVRMGVAREWFVDAMSSGEVAYQRLGQRKAYVIGRAGEDYGLDGVPTVGDVRDADILLILGSDAPRTSLADYATFFKGVALPAVCCNPDKLMLTPSGLQPAPGAIAALYESLGGTVEWIGKPYREIYDAACRLLGPARKVLCVGDSAEHDVAGGRNAGLTTLLVLTGVSQGVDPKDIHPQADYLMPAFRW
jgi:HAD superfamily hydrolase (TIGR01459 family)